MRKRPHSTRLTLEEVRLFLPDCPVIAARWVVPGAAFTELRAAHWAHIHVLGLVSGQGIELSGPHASAAGWGLRSYQPGKGWVYFETRRGRKKGKPRGTPGPYAF